MLSSKFDFSSEQKFILLSVLFNLIFSTLSELHSFIYLYSPKLSSASLLATLYKKKSIH